MPIVMKRIAWHPDLIAPALLLLAAAYFGANRGFGAFLIAPFVLLLLFFLSLTGVIWMASLAKHGSSPAWAAAMILAAPLVYFGTYRWHDRVQFAGWSLFHFEELRREASHDGVISHWDSWGFLGNDNDSYLISDSRDDAMTVPSADRWRVRMHLQCPIVDTARMWRGLYIVTTYNCTFDAKSGSAS